VTCKAVPRANSLRRVNSDIDIFHATDLQYTVRAWCAVAGLAELKEEEDGDPPPGRNPTRAALASSHHHYPPTATALHARYHEAG
jgi:hypothetical protein